MHTPRLLQGFRSIFPARTGLRFKAVLCLALTASLLFANGQMREWVMVSVFANNAPQTLPFSQNWTDAGQITLVDNWSGVLGIEGYLGQDLTTGTGTDPQLLLGTSSAGSDLTVLQNQVNPNTTTNGDVAEFDQIANPTIALQGSATADAPYILLYLNTTAQTGINVAYNLRDIDGSGDNAVQPVALQYRVGDTGSFTNLPSGFVADATTGPNLATQVTPVSVTLPAAANNQPLVQVRIMTTNAVGSDEWVGVDDISVTAAPAGGTPTISINDFSIAEGTGAGTTTATFTVSLTALALAGGVTFDIATADNGSASSASDYTANTLTSQTIAEGNTTYTFNVNITRDTEVEPNETFLVNISNVVGADSGDLQGLGTILNDDVQSLAINAIQGNGATSPHAGEAAKTTGIVTALRSNGFYIQEPDASVDADPNTSEGIFVFTSSAPPAGAVVGNSVEVTGTIAEFIPATDLPSPSLTELTSPTINQVLSTGNALPTAVTLTTADTPPGGTLNQLERLEGMRVRVDSLTVIAPTQGSLSEANATSTSTGVFYAVITGINRPFREPGIQDPDPAPSGVTIPPVPRFDANPERLRVDSDAQTGSAPLDVTSGATVTNIIGVLDYAFRTYTILPDPTPGAGVTGNVSFTAVPAPGPNQFTVASFNMQRFYDTVNDASTSDVVLTTTAFNNRLNKASLAIRNVLRFPDIIGVVEMENLTTLQAVAEKVNNDAVLNAQPNPLYTAYLAEGNDVGGIDVGFLVKSTTVTVIDVVQLGLTATYTDPGTGNPALLNDRPPLVLRATVHPPAGSIFPITVIVNHLRSLNDINDPADGLRVRAKRRAQAEFLADLIQGRQTSDPNEKIISIGDYNAFQFNDGFVDSIGTIKGTPTPADQVSLASPDLVEPNLVELIDTAPADQRYSYTFDGNAQTLDHELITANLLPQFAQIVYARNNADFPEIYRSDPTRPERVSDHDIPVVYFTAGCTYAVTPPVRYFSAKASSGSFTVTANPGCDWAASEALEWLDFTSLAEGTGNGTVTFDIAANPGTARSGDLTIAGVDVSVKQGTNFIDVPADDIFYEFIGKLSAAGITSGCTADSFCPNLAITREQMAVFIIRAIGNFTPATPSQQDFVDVPPSHPFYAFIGDLYARGITSGCDFTGGVRSFCPSSLVTREQMAPFIIRALGEFNPPTPGSQRFVDVPPNHLFYAFIEEMAVRGITLGCDVNGPQYCPSAAVTRGQVAAFIARAFGL